MSKINITEKGKFSVKISNLSQALDYLDKFYQHVQLDNVGYIVHIKYNIAQCKIKNIRNAAHRTYKVEGNYYEVKNMITEWAEEKMEIYNLKNISQVLCYEVIFSTGILIDRVKKYDAKILQVNNRLYKTERQGSLFQAIAFYLHNIEWSDNIHARKVNLQELLNMSYEEHLTYCQKYFSEYIKKKKKLVNLYNTTQDGKFLINIIQDPSKIALNPQQINIVQMNKGYYVLKEASINITENDQRPIKERHMILARNAFLIAFDFEFNWLKISNSAMKSSEPKQINVTYGFPYEDKYRSKKFIGDNCCNDFLSFICTVSEEYKYKYNCKTYCISHNASSTEHIILLSMFVKYIENENYTLKFNHVNSTKIYSFSWKGIEFRDSILFYPDSLEKYTDTMEVVKKKKIDIDWDNVDWANPTDEMNEYATYDSISLYEAICRHNKLYNEIADTPEEYWYFDFKSGSSVSKYMGLDIENNKLMYNNLSMTDQLQHYYYGGRCESFFIGDYKKFFKDILKPDIYTKYLGNYPKATALKIDINSSYPFSMTKKVPGKFYKQQTDLNNIDEDKAYEIFCYIKYKDSYWKNFNFSLIPIKDDKGKLIFPNYNNDEFYSYVNIKDFEYEAIKDHIEIKIDKVIIYYADEFFKKMMEELYNKRLLSDNKGYKAIIKFIMNGCYGSIGLKCDRERLYLVKGRHAERICRKYREIHEYDLDNSLMKGWSMLTVKEKVEVCGMMQTASYIAALSRFALWKDMERLKNKGYFILYVDTDSIIFVDTNFKSVEQIKNDIKDFISNKLGMWKLEGITEKWFIQGLKMYGFGDELKCKGVRNPRLSDEEFKFHKIQHVTVWKRMREGFIQKEDIEKTMKFDYTKGIVSTTGEVTPYKR